MCGNEKDKHLYGVHLKQPHVMNSGMTDDGQMDQIMNDRQISKTKTQ